MNKALAFLITTNSINVLADYLFIPLYALFISKIGGGAQMAGFLFGIRFIASVFCGFFITKVKDKGALDDYLLEINYIIKGLCWVILGFFQAIPVMIAVQIILGISGSFGGPAFNSLVSEHLDSKSHIKEWGIWELVQNASVAIASIASGFILAAFGFGILFFIMAALEFASFGVLFYSRRKKLV